MADECRRCVAWVLYAPCTCQRECSSDLCAAMDPRPAPTASGPTHYHACNLAICADRGVNESRLLPPGGEVSTQWMAQCLDANDKIREVTFWLFRPDAERWAKDRIGANEIVRYALSSHEIRRYEDGSQYIGPWSPVVSDDADG